MAKFLLNDLQIKRAKPRAKSYRLFDGSGLALWISTTGVKSWQLRYRLDGKDQTATLGKLERLSLADARTKADELRRVAVDGTHLTAHKHEQRAKRVADTAATFAKFSEDWIHREARRSRWTPAYTEEVAASLRNHLAPLDRLPMVKITAPIAAPILAAVERRAPLMYEKVQRRLRAILDDAMEAGVITGNPLPNVRRRSKKGDRRHYPAVTDLRGVGEILRAARAADPCKGVQRAHALLAFTAMRVGEVVPAAWSEFDLDAGEWSIPRERMKRKDVQRGPHIVPLGPDLVKQLRQWREADGTGAMNVCPAPRDAEKNITAESIEKHYRNALGLAGKHSPHSWRSAFSTICRDAGKDGDVVEAQLDHVVGNKVAAAYDRADRLELRRKLMAWYEATLIAARDGADVLPIRRAAVHNS